MERDDAPRCPVCQVRFRGSSICSRCGANLEPLMLLAGKAYRLRQDAREALLAGDYERARALAGEAQESCSTQTGMSLQLLATWLRETGDWKLETDNSVFHSPDEKLETRESKFETPSSNTETWNSEVF